jgi:hypothetical protein
LDEPEESPRRKRRGLYGSYLLGTGENRIKLILIDPRSQLNKEKKSVLGVEQWAWLDRELRTDPTPITILGTGKSITLVFLLMHLIVVLNTLFASVTVKAVFIFEFAQWSQSCPTICFVNGSMV